MQGISCVSCIQLLLERRFYTNFAEFNFKCILLNTFFCTINYFTCFFNSNKNNDFIRKCHSMENV